jgi:hypothetical protein
VGNQLLTSAGVQGDRCRIARISERRACAPAEGVTRRRSRPDGGIGSSSASSGPELGEARPLWQDRDREISNRKSAIRKSGRGSGREPW